MAQKKETVYLKADRNIEVEKRAVTLGDVLKIESVNPILLAKLKAIRLLKFQKESSGRPKKQERQAVSILKVIELIHEEYPDVEIENVGESDFIVTYEEQKSAGGIWPVSYTHLDVYKRQVGAPCREISKNAYEIREVDWKHIAFSRVNACLLYTSR